jgi:hypothetical protein
MIQDDLHLSICKNMAFALQNSRKNDYRAEREEEPKRREEQWRDKRGQWRNRGRGISGGNGETLMG